MAANGLRRAALADGIAHGLLFGLAMGMLDRFSYHESWPRAVVGFAVSGVLFGAWSAFWNRKSRRKQLGFLTGLAPSQRRQVQCAAAGGPVPQDARVRARAAELAMWSQGEWRRLQTVNSAVLAVVLIGNIALALTDSPWWWLTAPGVAAALLKVRIWPARLERRVSLLRAG